MKIEIEIRDRDNHGKRLGIKNVILQSCRVYRQEGDGLRLENLSPLSYRWFHGAALVFINDDQLKASVRSTLPAEKRIEQYEKEV